MEETLCRALTVLGIMDVKALVIQVMAFCHIGISYESRHSGNQVNASAQHPADGQVVRIILIGIAGKNAPGQFIHNVAAGSLENDILHEAVGQGPSFIQNMPEGIQLILVGKFSEEQQEAYFFKAKTSIRPASVYDILHIDAPVTKAAFNGHLPAFIHDIAVDIPDLGQPNQDSGTIIVAKAPFDTKIIKEKGIDFVIVRSKFREPGDKLIPFHVCIIPIMIIHFILSPLNWHFKKYVNVFGLFVKFMPFIT
jgi:hypothetical protein